MVRKSMKKKNKKEAGRSTTPAVARCAPARTDEDVQLARKPGMMMQGKLSICDLEFQRNIVGAMMPGDVSYWKTGSIVKESSGDHSGFWLTISVLTGTPSQPDNKDFVTVTFLEVLNADGAARLFDYIYHYNQELHGGYYRFV